MTTRRRLSSAFLLLCLAWLPARVEAEPFLLTPGDVLRATFDLRWYMPPPSLEVFDVFEFIPSVVPLTPIGSYTVRLVDRGRVLGTYTGVPPGPGQSLANAPFVTSTSIYTRGNPTVIDFSSFHDGSFDGAVEFTIESGQARVSRVSDELNLGVALTPDIHTGPGFAPSSFEIAPVPEPASLLLVASGAAGIALRRRTRRQARGRRHA